MKHPDKPDDFSSAPAGEIEQIPEDITAAVITDVDDNPAGVLEKWSDTAWIFAEADALRELN